MFQDRSFRALTLLTTALATPLLIGCTVASLQNDGRWYHRRRTVSTFCFGFIPLAITATSSIVATARPGRLSRLHVSLLDFSAAVTYVALLIPIWTYEVSRMNKGGLGLLIGYTTAPMIVNMFFHIYSFLCNLAYVSNKLFSRAGHECPNCHSKFNTETIKVAKNGKESEGYSLLRGEDYLDEDAVAYTEARASEEQVGVQGAADVEEVKGKGTIKL